MLNFKREAEERLILIYNEYRKKYPHIDKETAFQDVLLYMKQGLEDAAKIARIRLGV